MMVLSGTHREENLTPLERGELAYTCGLSHGDNPYPKGSREHAEWSRGMSSKGDPGL